MAEPPVIPNLKIPQVQPNFAQLQSNIDDMQMVKLPEAPGTQESVSQSSSFNKPRDQSSAAFLRQKLLAACIAHEPWKDMTEPDLTEGISESTPLPAETAEPAPTAVVVEE